MRPVAPSAWTILRQRLADPDADLPQRHDHPLDTNVEWLARHAPSASRRRLDQLEPIKRSDAARRAVNRAGIPLPRMTVRRPPLTRSSTASSAASLSRWSSGASAAPSVSARRRVRPATADTTTIGELAPAGPRLSGTLLPGCRHRRCPTTPTAPGRLHARRPSASRAAPTGPYPGVTCNPALPSTLFRPGGALNS